jgi:SAM-dependent methyltransferase
MSAATGARAVGREVRRFYEVCSFPGYEDFDTPSELIERSKQGFYANLLDDQLPLGVRVLDAGCGTGQLAMFLSLMNRKVVGADFSHGSLEKAVGFKRRFGLQNVSFVQTDLLEPALRPESFDFVFCNGVLHHTADAYGGFQNLCRLVKRGGYITIGLYNTYGRLLLDLRRWIFRMTGDRLTRLDAFMRRKGTGDEKKRVWFLDQYKNPHEDKFSVDTVLGWFARNEIGYVNSIPKIRLGESLRAEEALFEPRPAGHRVEHVLRQLGWILTQGKEGGFFLTIGRRL